MPFLICRHRQRGIDKRDDHLRELRCAAIADPLSIAAIDQETGSFESRNVARHSDWLAPSSRINSQTQCSRPSHTNLRASSWVGSARAERIVREFIDLPCNALMRITAYNISPLWVMQAPKEIICSSRIAPPFTRAS